MSPGMHEQSIVDTEQSRHFTALKVFDCVENGVAFLDSQRRFLYYNPVFNRFLCEQTGLELNATDLLGQSLPIASFWEAEPSSEQTPWRLQTPGGKCTLSGERLSRESSLLGLHPQATYMLQLSLNTRAQSREAHLANAITVGNQDDREKLELLTSFSHEFRTPLNAVMGFGNLLLDEVADNPRQRDFVEGIIGAGSHLLKLVNEILTLSRADYECSEIALSTENVDVGELISESIAMLQPLLDSADVSLTQTGPGARLICDRTRLKQVMLNLLSNAIKYNKPGGEVVVKCLAVGNRCAGIEVRDTGIGIPAEMTETIFNPFKRLFQGKPNTEGSGLGLMLTRRLVNMMGGQVRVASQPDAGSVFTVDFNLDEDMAGTAGLSRQSVLWLGRDAESAQFAQHLLGLRPGIHVQIYDYIPVAELGNGDIQADVVFVNTDLLDKAQVEEQVILKSLLQSTPGIGIVNDEQEGLARNLFELGVVKRVDSPLDPVGFLGLFDRVLDGAREYSA